jgi:Icc-related predicted phosphoesterase
MDDYSDVNPEIKAEYINHEIQAWKNTKYLASVRARVGAATGNKDHEMIALRDLEAAIKSIDFLNDELKNVQKELEDMNTQRLLAKQR